MSKRKTKKAIRISPEVRAFIEGHRRPPPPRDNPLSYDALRIRQMDEARASVELDGCTQSCDACQGEYVTVRMDGKRLDEIVGYGRFHLEDNGGSWFLDLGGRMMSLTSRKATPIDAEFREGTVAKPAGPHRCGRREMTTAEAELVEAALEAGFSTELLAPNRLWAALDAVRAERARSEA